MNFTVAGEVYDEEGVMIQNMRSGATLFGLGVYVYEDMKRREPGFELPNISVKYVGFSLNVGEMEVTYSLSGNVGPWGMSLSNIKPLDFVRDSSKEISRGIAYIRAEKAEKEAIDRVYERTGGP